MFGIPSLGGARIREALHRFGPRNPKKTRLAAERPSSEWMEEGKRKHGERDEEGKSQSSDLKKTIAAGSGITDSSACGKYELYGLEGL